MTEPAVSDHFSTDIRMTLEQFSWSNLRRLKSTRTGLSRRQREVLKPLPQLHLNHRGLPPCPGSASARLDQSLVNADITRQ